jgi:hypothetical protein
MKIACLGWGSLIWDPKELPVSGAWQKDGPVVPVEFLRQSGNGRITLVLDANGTQVPSLWTRLKSDNIDSAIAALQKREEIGDRDVIKGIGRWVGTSPPPLIPGLSDWAGKHCVDAVVWTALGFSSKGHADRRSADEVVQYLKTLRDEARSTAESYVRRAPKQIDTAYRRRIEAELGWTPLDNSEC